MYYAIGFQKNTNNTRGGDKPKDEIAEKSEKRGDGKIQIPPPHLERGYLHNLRPLVISEIQ